MKFTRCIMILADGARADLFEELLAAGDLPHIQRHICERGSYRRGTTVFPSTTGPAYLPYVTGCQPATCNVPGIRWMDKARHRDGTRRGVRSYVGLETFRFNRDIAPQIQTIFGMLPRSYNIFNAVNRGVQHRHNITQIARAWYWYYAHLTDRWGFVDQAASHRLHRVIEQDFQFCFVVFPGIDEYAHLHDPLGPRTREAYRTIDATVGSIAQRLERQGRLSETLWWIVSDHGLTATREHFCLNTWLGARGCKPLFYPLVYRRGCLAANMMSGNGMTHLYFRHRDGWARQVTGEYLDEAWPGLQDDLLHQPAVDLLALRADDGAVTVRTAHGEARLHLVGDQVRYTAVRGDPLEVFANEWVAPGDTQLRTILLTKEAALQRTMGTRFPDGPYQLAHLFTSPRCGDVVVSAAPGFDLRLAYEVPEHRGSHGSLHRDHMHVPVACSAPLTEGALRSVDVFPTTLTLMGHATPAGIDGVSRISD